MITCNTGARVTPIISLVRATRALAAKGFCCPGGLVGGCAGRCTGGWVGDGWAGGRWLGGWVGGCACVCVFLVCVCMCAVVEGEESEDNVVRACV